MKPPTLAEKLGIIASVSPLLEKARRLGIDAVETLESLAVARGCWHYRHPELAPARHVSELEFSNEELAISLLSPSRSYSAHTLRVGAAMLGAAGNQPETLAILADEEHATQVVRYIAEAASHFEPENPFWPRLLAHLPATTPMPDGVMPHPTRFVSMTGLERGGRRPPPVWVRPRPDLVSTHG